MYYTLPIICECRHYTSHIHLLNSIVFVFPFSHFLPFGLSSSTNSEMAIVTITLAAKIIIECKEMLAMQQTAFRYDSLVRLHNVASAHPPWANTAAAPTGRSVPALLKANRRM